MSAEAIVREEMRRDGWRESSNKHGLFYRKYKEEGYTIFIDLRNNTERYYGFTEGDDNEQVDDAIVDKCTRKIRKMLPAIGCSTIEEFPEENNTERLACPWCSKPLYCRDCDEEVK